MIIHVLNVKTINAVQYCKRVILLYNDENRIKLPVGLIRKILNTVSLWHVLWSVGKVSPRLRLYDRYTTPTDIVYHENVPALPRRQCPVHSVCKLLLFHARGPVLSVGLTMIVTDSAGLTVPFAILCIVDLFGIFPIIVLPGPIIKCGKWTMCVIFGGGSIIRNAVYCYRMVGNTVGLRRVCGSSVHSHSVGEMLAYGRRNRTEHREEKSVMMTW